MLRVPVLLCLLGVCDGAHEVPSAEKDADLKALDLADQEVANRLPPNPAIKLEKPKVEKAPHKALRHKVHPHFHHLEPVPDEKTKSSVLWAHDREMKFADEAAKVLEAGDKAAEEKIREEKEAKHARVAPAKVVHVSEKESEAAKKADDDALEGARDMDQDLKDLKDRETDMEAEEHKQNEEAAEEAQVHALEAKRVASPVVKPEKKVDLDHLMNLSAEIKTDAIPNATIASKNKTEEAFLQETPATNDHRYAAMKNLAASVRKAKAKADEPEEEATIPSPAPKKGEVTPDKLQRLQVLASKMQDAASGQPGTGPKVVVEESSAETAAADEGELTEGEQVVAIPQAIPQANIASPPATKFSTKVSPQTVASRSFKGAPLKNEVKQAANEFHKKIADHVVNMHAALRDHAVEMENKAKEAKMAAEAEAARKVKEEQEAIERKKHEAEEAAIAAQKAAENQRLREKAEQVNRENAVAARAKKAMADQAAQSQQSQQKVVAPAELKARDEAHKKMLAYREQQKKEREEQQREKDLIAKDALEAEKAAETLRALENELPLEKKEQPKKSGAAAIGSLSCAMLAIFVGAH